MTITFTTILGTTLDKLVAGDTAASITINGLTPVAETDYEIVLTSRSGQTALADAATVTFDDDDIGTASLDLSEDAVDLFSTRTDNDYPALLTIRSTDNDVIGVCRISITAGAV